MQQALIDASTTQSLQDRMGYLTLRFSIQGHARLNERDWSKYIACLHELNQAAQEGNRSALPEAVESFYENWKREGGVAPPDDLYRLKLAFRNNEYAKEAISSIQKALLSTPCFVI